MKHVSEFINGREVTKREFIHWFEKKFLYTIRKFNMMKHGDVITYLPAHDFRSIVLKHLLEKFEVKGGIELIKIKKGEKPKKKFKLALPTTSDLTSLKVIVVLIKTNVEDLKLIAPTERHVIKPLYLFLDKEVKLYAKLLGLKYKKSQFKFDSLNIFNFIEDMEKKHPELKYSIVKSYLELMD